jgi:hypothetical protein
MREETSSEIFWEEKKHKIYYERRDIIKNFLVRE